MSAAKPIIVIKKKSGHGGHHGGAWKVAYADFVTAMMALFIVLWLLSSSTKVKKAVAGYFQDPRSSHKESGSDKVGAGESIPIDKENAEKLKQQIQKAIKDQKELEKLAKQIEISITPEGLRIEMIEDKKGTFFQSGSAKLSDTGQALLGTIAGQLKTLPNRLLLEGHTDSQPYASDNGYTNWELSADRANSARRLLQLDGVGPTQISQVRGYADQLLRVKTDSMDPTNRRISLIVQWVEVPEAAGSDHEKSKPGESKVGESKPGNSKAGVVAQPLPDGKAASVQPAPTPPAKPAAGVAPAAHPANPGLLDRLKGIVSKNKPPGK